MAHSPFLLLRFFIAAFVLVECAYGISTARAEESKNPYSANMYGALGLNTVPSARMDAPGTIRAGVSTLDPYAHSWIGLQIAKPLSITLRQSAEISSLRDDANSLHPGIDLKLRLLEETRSLPEIAVGLQSALGHKRLAGEYIAFSKRYNDFDFTAGLGWGRYSGWGDLDNPLGRFSSHFDGTRDSDGENPVRSGQWFTGDTGLFAGIEYFTPIEGLSLKFDYNDDPYRTEDNAGNFKAPAPWSAAINYKPRPWVDLSVGTQGTDKIMARISLQNSLNYWRKQDTQDTSFIPTRATARTEDFSAVYIQNEAIAGETLLYDAHSLAHEAKAQLILKPGYSGPRQLANGFTAIANHAGGEIEKLTITPRSFGLRGPQISIMRRSLEQAGLHNQGSAEEIWRHTEFTPDGFTFLPHRRPDISLESEEDRNIRDLYGLSKALDFTLETQLSLSEEDNGLLYRTSLLSGYHTQDPLGFFDHFASLRINLKDNLNSLEELRGVSLLPVRGNVDDFTQNRIAIDRLYSAFTHSFRSDLHLSLMGGYLEEMYGGFGGEILYRPFNSRFAIGAESWLALKREPESFLATGYNGDSILSGHLNAWYDVPLWDTTLKLSVGRYLAGDVGASIGLEKNFANGAKLETFFSLSNADEPDIFGGSTHDYHGVRLTLPLGGFSYAPRNAKMRFEAAPFGREVAQRLDNPLPLYDLTQPFSMPHLEQHWDEITR